MFKKETCTNIATKYFVVWYPVFTRTFGYVSVASCCGN